MHTKSKKISVPFIGLPNTPSAKETLRALANLNAVQLQPASWSNNTDAVNADFVIAHNGDSIFLKYAVTENHLVAKASTNGNIFEDSCVELFLDLDNSGSYYNLEFNCLGWAKVAYGNAREPRELVEPSIVELISSHATINSNVVNGVKTFFWEIVLVIPIAVFCYTANNSFTSINAKGNFYKCGDSLPQPHYLVWNTIESAEPDFHRPEFFGELYFE